MAGVGGALGKDKGQEVEEIRDMGEGGLGRVGKAQKVGTRVGRGTEAKEKARRVRVPACRKLGETSGGFIIPPAGLTRRLGPPAPPSLVARRRHQHPAKSGPRAPRSQEAGPGCVQRFSQKH